MKARSRRTTNRPTHKLSQAVNDPAIEEALSRQTAAASMALREKRGELFRRPKTKTEPCRVLDELDVMLQRGEIDAELYRAGRRYGDRYREAHLRNTAISSLRENTRQGNHEGRERDLVGRVITMQKLAKDRACFAVNDTIGRLCDDVFGADYRLENNAGRAGGVDILKWALTRLCYHYGIRWWSRAA